MLVYTTLANNKLYIQKYAHIIFDKTFFMADPGVAVYTGMETKMALNYQSKSQKRSAVEK